MGLYPYCPRPDSSGFEHVFVGETRGGRTVIGFHNWIQLYLQEKLGHIDYKGYSVNANSPQVSLLSLKCKGALQAWLSEAVLQKHTIVQADSISVKDETLIACISSNW